MMKTNKRIFLLLILLVAGLSGMNAQDKKEKKELHEKAVKQQVESESYKIDVSTAYPRRGKTVHLSSNYSVEVRNDSVFSYLPYFGRAYSIPYGGGEGLIFKAPISEYKMETKKKGAMKVDFIARSKEDRFQFRMTIYSNGSASFDVFPQNRESIAFSGEVTLPSEQAGKSGI